MTLKWLKKDKGLTLLETVVAMLIISTSAAGVLGSFSYAFKFVQRAGKKTEAANINRKAVEMYRAISMADSNDSRLAVQANADITSNLYLDTDGDGKLDYNETVRLTISNWDATAKQININVEWTAP